MVRKEVEGGNRQRRAAAREARKRGHLPSEEGVTLGSSKQRLHLDSHEDHVEKVESKHRHKQHLRDNRNVEKARPGSRGRRRRRK